MSKRPLDEIGLPLEAVGGVLEVGGYGINGSGSRSAESGNA